MEGINLKDRIISEYRKILYQNKSGIVHGEWSDSLFVSNFFGVTIRDYIWNEECKLNLQQKIIEKFSKIIWFPGIWPCYHLLDITSVFGVELEYSKNNNNFSYKPGILDCKKIDLIKKNELNYDLQKRICSEYVYLHKNIYPKLKSDYGYLDGIAFTTGPLESAAIIMGYENFFINLKLNIKLVLKLLDMICEEIIIWLREQEKINGKLVRIYMPDHIPSLISKEMFSGLLLKYFIRILSEFKGAEIFYHNEGNSDHILEEIKKMQIKIFNCGNVNMKVASKILKNTILMGNINSNIIKQEDDSTLLKELDFLINLATKNKIFISSAGGIHAGIPEEKINFVSDYIYKNLL